MEQQIAISANINLVAITPRATWHVFFSMDSPSFPNSLIGNARHGGRVRARAKPFGESICGIWAKQEAIAKEAKFYGAKRN
jgi:hypothetical protein